MKKKGQKDQYFKGSGPKNLLIAVIIIIASLAVLTWLTDYSMQVKPISYSNFLKKVENDEVKWIKVTDQDVQGVLKDNTRFETTIADNQKNWDVLREHNVEVEIMSSAGQFNLWYLLPLLSFLITIMAIWYFIRQSRNSGGGGGGSNIFTMGKSRARMFMPSMIKENFNSVAGAAEAKEELKDIVDFLRSPEKYKRLGAKMTRGILLVGEPGNGKTLLAKAVAGEANCPFFSISGSDFIEVFVGVGASRVRDLFAQARKNAPSIVFIDEIDAVGRHRGSGLGGGHDEREQTLNQLLTEMDGFQTTDESVVVIAATNRPDVLDKALLRPGRFDRRVEVPYPDLVSREQILQVHAKGVKIDPTVDLHKIARGTPGFSGADLMNLINEAAIIASKTSQNTVTIQDFEEARDKIMLGKENKTMIQSKRDLEIVSYHESGHALMGLLNPAHTDPLHKITIIPRGQALGVTHSLPERDKQLKTKDEMYANIVIYMGGKAAEELVFNIVTTGPYSDLRGATEIARKMVTLYGMTEKLGVAVYQRYQGSTSYSQKTGYLIDQEVQRILDEAYQKSLELLKTNRDKLDLLAKTLLEKETMYAGEVYELLGIEPREEHKFI
ncbi:MAG TPA: ATP-dependent zinc metalloprotease FtsH [Candidatus Limnocylindria bacterium]|nr:ATP-dependent zinc metalloprotease FtsH [Candidatus Limnocylindria bacterium]